MHVADLRICRELYELSGWEYSRAWFDQRKPWVSDYIDHNPPFICPAYDLGYLIRKLPHHRGSRTGAMLDLHLSAVDPGFDWRRRRQARNRALRAGHIDHVMFRDSGRSYCCYAAGPRRIPIVDVLHRVLPRVAMPIQRPRIASAIRSGRA